MSKSSEPVVYQLKVVLLGISPMIWRSLLLKGDSTIADLHYILQIAMGWTDSHLHQFTIHGKRYGIAQIGGVCFSDDPKQIKLSDSACGYERGFYMNTTWATTGNTKSESRPSILQN